MEREGVGNGYTDDDVRLGSGHVFSCQGGHCKYDSVFFIVFYILKSIWREQSHLHFYGGVYSFSIFLTAGLGPASPEQKTKTSVVVRWWP